LSEASLKYEKFVCCEVSDLGKYLIPTTHSLELELETKEIKNEKELRFVQIRQDLPQDRTFPLLLLN
jgi:hypothetical protein